MTKWAGIDASALSDSSSPRRVAKSSLLAAAKCCASACSVCCVLLRDQPPGCKTVPAEIISSRWDLHIGQVRSEIWTVPRLTARLIRGRKNVSGAELNPLSPCGVNHALHQADDSAAAAAGPRRFSGGGAAARQSAWYRNRRPTDAKTRTETLRNGKMFQNLERAACRGGAVAPSGLKGTADPGLPGVFGGSERNRRYPIPQNPNILKPIRDLPLRSF